MAKTVHQVLLERCNGRGPILLGLMLTWIFLAMLLRTRLVAMAFKAERMLPQFESMTTTSMSLVGRYNPAQSNTPFRISWHFLDLLPAGCSERLVALTPKKIL